MQNTLSVCCLLFHTTIHSITGYGKSARPSTYPHKQGFQFRQLRLERLDSGYNIYI